MIVSTNSWHYKLLVKAEKSASKSLCVYFWQVVLSLFTKVIIPWGMLGLVATAIAVGMYILGASMFLDWGLASKEFIDNSFWAYPLCFALGVSFMSLVVICLLVVLGLLSKLEKALISPKRDKEDRPASLLKAYLEARKSKLCPILEFKE